MWEFELPKNKEMPSLKRWRHGVLGMGKLPEDYPYPCIDSIEMTQKSFDYGNRLGAMAAIAILTENVARFSRPSSWWDATKERFLPEWILRKRPVKYDRIDIKALYPYATFKDEQIIWKASIKHDENPIN